MIQKNAWVDLWTFLNGLGIAIPESAKAALEKDLSFFLQILQDKNEQINLTAIKSQEEALWKHLADSLAVLQLEPLGALLDWGSGGGFPGLPMSIYRKYTGDSSPIYYLDSVGKKLKCIEEFSLRLGLSTEASECFFHMRGEAFLQMVPSPRVDTIIMRAVAPPEEAVKWLSKKVSRWVFMSSPAQIEKWRAQEKKARSRDFSIERTVSYSLPHGMGERALLVLSSV